LETPPMRKRTGFAGASGRTCATEAGNVAAAGI
jgi:hypothetical protein